jgi:NAD(P)-dependent dehydrogenase (short-subunit alcohol dehydrogenase family)
VSRSTPRSVPRSAVVTGAGRGIGAAMAAQLVQQGYAVVVTDLDGAAAAATAERVGAVGAVEHDVREEQAAHEVARVAGTHAPLAVWMNNAGVGFDGATADQDADRIRQLVATNLLGMIWGMRAAVDAFRGQSESLPRRERGGDIVNTSSLSALGPVPGLSVYAATKAAVLSLTMSWESELRHEGIRVHAVNPDGVETPLLDQMEPRGQGSALVHSGSSLLTPEEVARAAVDLVGSRRVYRTVPAWRGAVMRGTALAPGLLMRLEPLLRRQGQWMAAKQGR